MLKLLLMLADNHKLRETWCSSQADKYLLDLRLEAGFGALVKLGGLIFGAPVKLIFCLTYLHVF